MENALRETTRKIRAENTLKLSIAFPTYSVAKGDVIGSALFEGKWYDAVWIGDDGSNFKLVERKVNQKSNKGSHESRRQMRRVPPLRIRME